MPIQIDPRYARRGEGRSPRTALAVNDGSDENYEDAPYQQAGFEHFMQVS
jgi:hypothetical protein